MSLSSKFSGSLWGTVVLRQIEKLLRARNLEHQLCDVLNVSAAISFSQARALAFKQITVVDTATPSCLFEVIHAARSSSSSGNWALFSTWLIYCKAFS